MADETVKSESMFKERDLLNFLALLVALVGGYIFIEQHNTWGVGLVILGLYFLSRPKIIPRTDDEPAIAWNDWARSETGRIRMLPLFTQLIKTGDMVLQSSRNLWAFGTPSKTGDLDWTILHKKRQENNSSRLVNYFPFSEMPMAFSDITIVMQEWERGTFTDKDILNKAKGILGIKKTGALKKIFKGGDNGETSMVGE